jgi:transcriptional regulator with XRE-family HTH domain
VARPDGRIIRKLRLKQGLRQLDLARKAGLAEKTIKRIEAGQTAQPNPDTVAYIAKVLNVAPEELFPRELSDAVEPGVPAGDSGFVGRDAQLALLWERLTEAKRGRAQVVWVAGEPGAGKSALMDELIRRARAAGFGVVKGSCYESPGAPSFLPWQQVFGVLAEDMSTAALRRIAGESESDLSVLLPALAARTSPDREEYSDRDRFRLFKAAARVVRERSRKEPLLLILDDLHCADTPSLRLWQALARELRAARVALIATYRHTEVDAAHPLAEICSELLREVDGCRIALPGLRPEEIQMLVGRIRADAGAAALSRVLFERTEGNPFFVLQLLHALRDQPGLTSEEFARLCPVGVSEAIQLRLQKLGSEVTQVLRIAAVVGRQFAWRIVEDVSAAPVGPALELAMRQALVREVPGRKGIYEFSHMLFRDALHDQIPVHECTLLHQAIAETLVARHGAALTPHLAALAYHFLESGPAGHARGIEYSRVAAADAVHRMAFEEAIRLYATALHAVEHEGARAQRTLCELLLALGDAQNRSGNGVAANESFGRAAGIARHLGAGDLLARAALGIGMRFGQIVDIGVYDDAQIALLREALEALPESEAELRAQVLALLAMSLFWTDEFESCAILAAEAVATAERSGHALTQFRTLMSAYLARSLPGVQGRAETIIKLEQIASRTQTNEILLHAAVLRTAETLRFMDRMGPFDQAVARLGKLSRRGKEPWIEWWVLGFRIVRALIHGDAKTRADLTEQQYGLGERADAGMVELTLGAHRYRTLLLQGRWEEIHEVVARMVELYPSSPSWPCVALTSALQLGRRRDVERDYREIIDRRFRNICQPLLWPACFAMLSELCFEFEDGPRARRLEQVLRPHAHENLVAGLGGMFLGPATRALGLLAAAQHRLAEARVYLADALSRSESMGAVALALQVEIDLLRVDARAGGPASEIRAQCEQLSERARAAGWCGLDAQLSRLARDGG